MIPHGFAENLEAGGAEGDRGRQRHGHGVAGVRRRTSPAWSRRARWTSSSSTTPSGASCASSSRSASSTTRTATRTRPARSRSLADPGHAAASRDVARKSIVLLKNEGGLLPLDKGVKTIAVIGPLAADKDTPLGELARAGRGGLGRVAPRGDPGGGARLDAGRPRRGGEARDRPAQLHGALGRSTRPTAPASRPRSRPPARPTSWSSPSARTPSSRARGGARWTSASRASRRS